MYDIHYHVYFIVSLLKYIEPKIRSSVRDLRLLDLMNDRDLCIGFKSANEVSYMKALQQEYGTILKQKTA
jgi:hypothetical protein